MERKPGPTCQTGEVVSYLILSKKRKIRTERVVDETIILSVCLSIQDPRPKVLLINPSLTLVLDAQLLDRGAEHGIVALTWLGLG